MTTAQERVSEKWMAVADLAVDTHHAVQKASELAELLTLLANEIRPRTVLEIGSDLGGSLYAWSRLPSVERVYAVTLPPPPGYDHMTDYHGAHVIVGDSHSMTTARQVWEAIPPPGPDVVYIDGDHSNAGCTQDIKMYGLMGRQLMVLHDIVVHPQFPSCRVHEVWAVLRSWRGTMQFSEIVHEPRTWGGFGLIRW